jgi:hypothetical protein
MDIKPNSSDGRAPQLRFDPTKSVRDMANKRQPVKLDDAATAESAETKAPKDPATIEAARAQHRANFQQRVSDQRERYLKNHATERADKVAKARADYVATRKANAAATQPETKTEKGADQIAISNDGHKMLARILERAAQSNAPQRDERIKELTARYLDGRLNITELVDRAADKMLSGE